MLLLNASAEMPRLCTTARDTHQHVVYDVRDRMNFELPDQSLDYTMQREKKYLERF